MSVSLKLATVFLGFFSYFARKDPAPLLPSARVATVLEQVPSATLNRMLVSQYLKNVEVYQDLQIYCVM